MEQFGDLKWQRLKVLQLFKPETSLLGFSTCSAWIAFGRFAFPSRRAILGAANGQQPLLRNVFEVLLAFLAPPSCPCPSVMLQGFSLLAQPRVRASHFVSPACRSSAVRKPSWKWHLLHAARRDPLFPRSGFPQTGTFCFFTPWRCFFSPLANPKGLATGV